jgi:hypothetical protein
VPQRFSTSVPLALLALALAGAPAALPEAAGAQAAKPAPKAGPDAEKVKASFDAFASEWMGKMQRLEVQNRQTPKLEAGAVSYRGYGEDFRVEIRPTGYAPAPYVGVLRYEEHTFGCTDASATHCRVTYRLPVTELFRYQNGHWIY